MANNAHFVTSGPGAYARVIIRDDRGAPVTELDLPEEVTEPTQADAELRAAGWTRRSDTEWTQADDGWVVPVVPT
ncbi:hypothetical protein GCM10027174_30320 [Salinifilum aidingensis]